MTVKSGQTRTKTLPDGTVLQVTLHGTPPRKRKRKPLAKRKSTPGKGR